MSADEILARSCRAYQAVADAVGIAALCGRSLDYVRPGGLGIHLIRQAFTDVDYQLKSQGTELVLAKKFGASSNGGSN